MFNKKGPVYKLVCSLARAGYHINDIAKTADISKNTVYAILRKEDLNGMISVKRHSEIKAERREMRVRNANSSTTVESQYDDTNPQA